MSGRILLICDCGNGEAAADARALFEDTALRLVSVSLDRHDRYMAYVLGLSHAVNIAFAHALVKSGFSAQELDRVASTTFSKQARTTREVAFENPRLYYEIQHQNAHTPEVIEALAEAVAGLKHAALSRTPKPFEQLMDENRRYFEQVAPGFDDDKDPTVIDLDAEEPLSEGQTAIPPRGLTIDA